MSSCPVAGCLGQEAKPHLPTTTFQVVEEWEGHPWATFSPGWVTPTPSVALQRISSSFLSLPLSVLTSRDQCLINISQGPAHCSTSHLSGTATSFFLHIFYHCRSPTVVWGELQKPLWEGSLPKIGLCSHIPCHSWLFTLQGDLQIASLKISFLILSMM